MRRAGFLFFVIALCSCQSVPRNIPRTESRFDPRTENTRLGRSVQPQVKSHEGETGVYSLLDGTEALVSRIRALSWADRTADLQYYIWHDDLTGRLLLSAVLRAADRGVRVRLLLDDLNLGPYERTLAILDLHPNIEVRLANPFANRIWRFLDLFRFSQINRRMHNKVLIADNQVAIMGGRNIGDEYFAASDSMNFSDFDLWLVGETVTDFSREFDAYWNSEISYPVAALIPDFKATPEDLEDLRRRLRWFDDSVGDTPYAETLKASWDEGKFAPFPPSIAWGKARAIIDSPEKLLEGSEETTPEKSIFRKLAPSVRAARKEILFISPYFVPGRDGVDFYRDLVARGLRVVVLTNSLASSDVSTVFSGYKKYRVDLLKAGVELYELKPTAPDPNLRRKRLGIGSSQSGLHGKSIFFDRRSAFVGSMNLDNRSALINTEMGLLFDDAEYAEGFTSAFYRALPEIAYRLYLTDKNQLRWEAREKGETVVFEREPETTWWQRFKAGVQAIFVPEHTL